MISRLFNKSKTKKIILFDKAYRKELVVQEIETSLFKEIKNNSPIIIYDDTEWKVQTIKFDKKTKCEILNLRRSPFSQNIKDLEVSIKRNKIKESFLSQPINEQQTYLQKHLPTLERFNFLNSLDFLIFDTPEYYKIKPDPLSREEYFIYPEILFHFQCKIVKRELTVYSNEEKENQKIPKDLHLSFWETLTYSPTMVIEYLSSFDNENNNIFTFLIQSITTYYSNLEEDDEFISLEDLHKTTLYFCATKIEEEIINSVFFESEVELSSLNFPDSYLYNFNRKNYLIL